MKKIWPFLGVPLLCLYLVLWAHCAPKFYDTSCCEEYKALVKAVELDSKKRDLQHEINEIDRVCDSLILRKLELKAEIRK